MRERVLELRRVRAGALLADSRNWRIHPAAQREALATMRDRIGNITAIIARETPDGLMIVDGHLRADIDPEQELPVLVVDLDDDEAGQALATIDPLAAMAEADAEALTALAENVPIDLAALYDLPPDFSNVAGVAWPEREPDEHLLGVMNFYVSEAQRELVTKAVSRAKSLGLPNDDQHNENSNSHGLAVICQQWLAQNP